MSETVEQATAKLWAYINSLPEDQKVQAIAYQTRLEAEAAKMPGGMNEVIKQHLIHHTASLAEVMDEVYELAAGKYTELALQKHLLPKT